MARLRAPETRLGNACIETPGKLQLGPFALIDRESTDVVPQSWLRFLTAALPAAMKHSRDAHRGRRSFGALRRGGAVREHRTPSRTAPSAVLSLFDTALQQLPPDRQPFVSRSACRGVHHRACAGSLGGAVGDGLLVRGTTWSRRPQFCGAPPHAVDRGDIRA
jgi:hypothetical protein